MVSYNNDCIFINNSFPIAIFCRCRIRKVDILQSLCVIYAICMHAILLTTCKIQLIYHFDYSATRKITQLSATTASVVSKLLRGRRYMSVQKIQSQTTHPTTRTCWSSSYGLKLNRQFSRKMFLKDTYSMHWKLCFKCFLKDM